MTTELPLLPGYTRVYNSPAGGVVDIHEEHGADERQANLEVAILLANRGEHVRLLPRTTSKSADATRNEEPWEFKRLENYTNAKGAVATAVRVAKEQASNILLHFPFAYPGAERVGRGLSQAVFHDKLQKIQRVAVLNGSHLHTINRAQIEVYNYGSLKK